MAKFTIPPAVDYEQLRSNILEENNKSLAILDETQTDIFTDDFDEDRHISYHLRKPDRQWLKTRFLWTASCQKDQAKWEDIMLDVLLHPSLPPELFIVLNRIIAVRTREDYNEACEVLDADKDEFPETLDPEEPDVLGVKWHVQNSVILDFNSIDAALDELKQETGYVDAYDREEAVILTLLHELRHLMLENNPFDVISETLSPADFTEGAVEEWARTMFEVVCAE